MARTRIQLGDGRWFNKETARGFAEETRWDGNNWISCATGSQWEHEELYLTASGNWILHEWSQWQGSTESFQIIPKERAMAWLSRHGHDDVVPDEVLSALEV